MYWIVSRCSHHISTKIGYVCIQLDFAWKLMYGCKSFILYWYLHNQKKNIVCQSRQRPQCLEIKVYIKSFLHLKIVKVKEFINAIQLNGSKGEAFKRDFIIPITVSVLNIKWRIHMSIVLWDVSILLLTMTQQLHNFRTFTISCSLLISVYIHTMAILVFFMQYQANGGAPFVNNEIPIAFVLFGIDSCLKLWTAIASKNETKKMCNDPWF